VPGAADSMMPFRPCEARKHAREAPAGPAPTMRNGVSTMWSVLPLTVVETMLMPIEAGDLDKAMPEQDSCTFTG
jgi:hypothetical protein